MIGPDGTVWHYRHHAIAYTPHHKITFLLDDATDANPAMAVTVILSPQSGGTLLAQSFICPTVKACTGAVAFGATELGQTTLAKLAAISEG